MKGRDEKEVLSGSMFQVTDAQKSAISNLRKAKRSVTCRARPAPGAPNLKLSGTQTGAAKLPAAGDSASPRAGSEAGYAAVAAAHRKKLTAIDGPCDQKFLHDP